MMEHAFSALSELLEPLRLLALFSGMLVGLIFGMLPGLGGVAAVSILLPFVYLMDDYAGLAMLLGAVAIVYTSDTITSVLLGAPGSPASAPTAMEGHALAKQGKAATALGVGFLSSMIGGLVGAVVLLFAIPVAGPVVLMLGTPELFMFALVGLVYASSMVGTDIARGLAAACLGLLLGVVGPASAAADFRFTFGQVYLLDGFSLTIVALGLFGVAEVVSMLAAGGGISQARMQVNHWGEGLLDFWKNRFLVIRSAFIGVFGGFVPAVGASASTWVAYGHAIRSSKDRSRFGKGDIRGIAASEGANNATVIADLVPTLLFSVPGGPAAAIFLGALFSFGYYPGPRMITQNPDLMFLIVWSVALASVVGALICFAVTPMLARLTRIPFAIIAAPLILIMLVGAYQATSTMGDIFMLFALGTLGWLMKHAEWPRAPALVGFVLAGPMEQYFWLSNQLFGWQWLLRPGVLIISAFILVPPLFRLWRRHREDRSGGENGEDSDAMAVEEVPVSPTQVTGQEAAAEAVSTETMGLDSNVLQNSESEDAADPRRQPDRQVSLILALLALAAFTLAAVEMIGFNPSSRLMPLLAVVPGLPLTCLLVWRAWSDRHSSPEMPGALSNPISLERGVLLILILYAVAIWGFGLTVPTVLLLFWMLWFKARMRWWSMAIYGSAILMLVLKLFDVLRGDAPSGALFPLGRWIAAHIGLI